MSSRPYFAADPAAWSVVVALFEGADELPLEVVLLDLAYLENEARRGNPFPSLAKLRRRWRWGRKRVERALAGELGEWHDPARPLSLTDLRTVGRAANRLGRSMQRSMQRSTPETGEAEEEREQEHAEEHAEEHEGTDLDGSTTGTEAGESAALARVDQPDQPDQPGTDPSDLSLVSLASERDEQASRRSTWKRDAVLAIYSHWRKRHPRAPQLAGDDEVNTIRKAVELVAKVAKGGPGRYAAEHYEAARADLCDLCDWIHTAPTASFWQGANNDGTKHLGITPCFKAQKLSDRLGQMRAWRDEGRDENPNLGLDRFKAEAAKAWDYLGRAMLRSSDLPEPVHADPRAAAAIEAGMRACGGEMQIRRSSEREEKALRAEFERAYAVSRRDGAARANTTREAM